jgi:hypothetical protein
LFATAQIIDLGLEHGHIAGENIAIMPVRVQ